MQQNWYLVKIHSYEFIECVFTKEQCLELLSFNLSNSLNFISASTHFLQVLCLFWKNILKLQSMTFFSYFINPFF